MLLGGLELSFCELADALVFPGRLSHRSRGLSAFFTADQGRFNYISIYKASDGIRNGPFVVLSGVIRLLSFNVQFVRLAIDKWCVNMNELSMFDFVYGS